MYNLQLLATSCQVEKKYSPLPFEGKKWICQDLLGVKFKKNHKIIDNFLKDYKTNWKMCKYIHTLYSWFSFNYILYFLLLAYAFGIFVNGGFEYSFFKFSCAFPHLHAIKRPWFHAPFVPVLSDYQVILNGKDSSMFVLKYSKLNGYMHGLC